MTKRMDPLHPSIRTCTRTNNTPPTTTPPTPTTSTPAPTTTTTNNKHKNKKQSIARRSINLAHLILNHSSHSHQLKSPFKTTPAKTTNHQHSTPLDSPTEGPLKSFECRVCERPISFKLNSTQPTHPPLPCSICGTIWDSPSVFISPQSHSIQPSPPELRIDQELLDRLNKLTLTPDQLELFDQNPTDHLAKLSTSNPPEFDRFQEFHQLTLTLISDLFSSTSTLSHAFRTHQQPTNLPSVQLIKDFFRYICDGPGGRVILCSALEQFLLHPSPETVQVLSSWQPDLPITSIPNNQDEYLEWAWAVVLLQCPILLPSKKIPQQKRLVMTARLLGLISFMPNRLHQQLIKFYGSSQAKTTQLLRQTVDLVNVFISERINFFLQVPNGFGAPSPPGKQASDTVNQLPEYMGDWSLLAASRVMTLLFESNLGSDEHISIETFYNLSIDLIDPNDLVYDFEIWETRRSKYYTICGYPCLLSLSSKINILTYEGKRQMGMEARQALFDSLTRHSLAPPVLVINVRRSHLIMDSLTQISLARDQLKKLIKINFVDEDGVDGGGLKKEWFLLLTRQLVGPEYGMFLHDEDSRQIWFNPASTEFDEFKLIGTILGLAIYNRVTLDIRLPSLVYKKLLGRQVSGLKDLSSLKPDVAKGLKWLLDYQADDVEEIFQRNFVGEYEAYGTTVQVPLIPGGENVAVNLSNREKFVELYGDFILNKSIQEQFKSFKEGFESITNANGFSLFQPHEIELLLIGSNYRTKFNIEDLQSITTYEGFDPNKDSTIALFWKVVDGFSFEDQKKLLRFMTGSDRIPAIGLTGLSLKISKSSSPFPPPLPPRSSSSNNNESKKKIPPVAMGIPLGQERLPESHTCFNQLVLDHFTDLNHLEHKLRLAVNESEGFSLT